MNDSLVPAYMVTMVSEIDATSLEKLRQEFKVASGIAPSWTALVIKAAALTMARNPHANRAILGPPFFRKIHQFSNTDISVAVEKDWPLFPGLAFASPIKDSFNKPLIGITTELRSLATCDKSNNSQYRAYARILKFVPPPLSVWLINAPYWFPSLWQKYRGCACWVNAPTKAGVDLVLTTWPWPITFSFGQVKERPTVIDGEIKVRLTMPVTMVFDRRIMGGGPAGRIFAQFKDILQSEVSALNQRDLMP